MRRLAFAFATLVLGATAVVAQNTTVIKERKAHFEAIGKATKPVRAMFKGEAEFDLAQVQAALKVIQEKVVVLPALFPDDSKTGEDTEALPVIWDKKADFEARFKKLGEAATTAQTAITDAETFPEAWKTLMGNCSGCHKEFRKPKS